MAKVGKVDLDRLKTKSGWTPINFPIPLIVKVLEFLSEHPEHGNLSEFARDALRHYLDECIKSTQ